MQTERLTSAISYAASATTGTLSAVLHGTAQDTEVKRNWLLSLMHGLSYEEWLITGVLVGIVFCALTFFVNLYFQVRRLKVEEQSLRTHNFDRQ